MSSPVAADVIASSQPAHPSRVLVVEDSALIRERLVDLIQSFPGVRVTAEADAENTALAALHEQTFDAAVIDLQLRQGSGFGVLRALRQLSPQPLTIVLTNSSMRAVRVILGGVTGTIVVARRRFLQVQETFDVLFPLTPALSLGERETRLAAQHTSHGEPLFPIQPSAHPLLGERAGVRGNGRLSTATLN